MRETGRVVWWRPPTVDSDAVAARRSAALAIARQRAGPVPANSDGTDDVGSHGTGILGSDPEHTGKHPPGTRTRWRRRHATAVQPPSGAIVSKRSPSAPWAFSSCHPPRPGNISPIHSPGRQVRDNHENQAPSSASARRQDHDGRADDASSGPVRTKATTHHLRATGRRDSCRPTTRSPLTTSSRSEDWRAAPCRQIVPQRAGRAGFHGGGLIRVPSGRVGVPSSPGPGAHQHRCHARCDCTGRPGADDRDSRQCRPA